MPEDITRGAAAAVRLAEGTPLRNVLDVTDADAWLALDAGARQPDWYRGRPLPAWECVAPLPADTSRLTEPRLALALCHRIGRIREAAVRQSVRHPDLLPLLVIRCADWAAPVRERAREALAEALRADRVDDAVGLAPLILRVGRRERGTFAVQLLEEALRAAPPERLAALFTAADRRVRRFTYRLAVANRSLSPAELARTALRDGDAVIQDLCATAALAAVRDGTAAYDDVLAPLLAARNPRIRSTGVTALRGAGRPRQAERFLGDRSAVVRACARYVVRQHGGDPAPWYRERCTVPDDPGLLPGAVIGLAECGDRADAGLLWPLLAHPVGAVRAQAVAGLRALERTDIERLRPLLDDPTPGVVREVTAALLPSAAALSADRLLARTGPGYPQHVRVAAFRLLSAHGGLTALRAAVGLLDDPDEKLRSWAGHAVQRWHPTADVRPGDPEVGGLLDRSRHLFSDYVLKRRKWEAGL